MTSRNREAETLAWLLSPAVKPGPEFDATALVRKAARHLPDPRRAPYKPGPSTAATLKPLTKWDLTCAPGSGPYNGGREMCPAPPPDMVKCPACGAALWLREWWSHPCEGSAHREDPKGPLVPYIQVRLKPAPLPKGGWRWAVDL